MKKITCTDSEIRIIKRGSTYANVRDIWNRNEDKLTDEEVNQLYLQLKELTKVSKKEKQEHIQNIEERYNVSKKQKDIQQEKMK